MKNLPILIKRKAGFFVKKIAVLIFITVSVLFSTGMARVQTATPVFTELKPICLYKKDEFELLEYVIQEEVRGASLKHKRIIANVILNRVRSDDFPDNVHDVIFQKGQFTSVRNCKEKNFTPDKTTKQAVYEVLHNNCEDLSQGALYFYAPRWTDEKTAKWFEENLTFLFELEGHRFFK